MGKTATNISIVLGIITIGFAGYYLYTERSAYSLDFSSDDQTLANMLNNTRVFIEYRSMLNKAKLDVAIFEDERFRSLQSFSTPLVEVAPGRTNPFAETTNTTARPNP